MKAPEAVEKTHLAVKQEDAPAEYEWTAFSVINLTFGFLDGALNAMPKGGHLSSCGINLRLQR